MFLMMGMFLVGEDVSSGGSGLFRNALNLAPWRPRLPGITFPSNFSSEMLRIWRPGVPGCLGTLLVVGMFLVVDVWEHLS